MGKYIVFNLPGTLMSLWTLCMPTLVVALHGEHATHTVIRTCFVHVSTLCYCCAQLECIPVLG